MVEHAIIHRLILLFLDKISPLKHFFAITPLKYCYETTYTLLPVFCLCGVYTDSMRQVFSVRQQGRKGPSESGKSGKSNTNQKPERAVVKFAFEQASPFIP